MKRTNNGILIPDVPIMAGGNLPNAVKGVSVGSNDPYAVPFFIDVITTLHITAVLGLEISDDMQNWEPTTERELITGRYFFRREAGNLRGFAIVKTDGEYFNVGGNLLSLQQHDFRNGELRVTFQSLLAGSNVVDASALLFPPNVIDDCYVDFFNNCASLISAPNLPARNLAEWCYQRMFYKCNSLSVASDLPAEVLAKGCYAYMYSTTAIKETPVLRAKDYVEDAYTSMFSNNLNLKAVTCLLEGENLSINGWLFYVSADGTFTKTTGASYVSGNDGIPSGWSVVNAN